MAAPIRLPSRRPTRNRGLSTVEGTAQLTHFFRLHSARNGLAACWWAGGFGTCFRIPEAFCLASVRPYKGPVPKRVGTWHLSKGPTACRSRRPPAGSPCCGTGSQARGHAETPTGSNTRRSPSNRRERHGPSPREGQLGRSVETGVVVRCVPIRTPLPHVAVHVVKPPGVWLELTYRVRLAPRIGVGPRILIQLVPAVAVARMPWWFRRDRHIPIGLPWGG